MPVRKAIALRAMNFLALLVLLGGIAQGQTRGMVEFFAGGKLQKGVALIDLAHEVVVIGRDGWMHSLDPRKP